MEGITKGISKRTVQGDIQIMRSDKLGYNAPIETYGNGYYRYSDPDYSISDTPLTDDDYLLVVRTIKLIGKYNKYNEKGELSDLNDALTKVKDKLSLMLRCG